MNSNSTSVRRRIHQRVKKVMAQYLPFPEQWTEKERKLFALRLTTISFLILKRLLVNSKLSNNNYYSMYWNQNISNTIPNPFAMNRNVRRSKRA